MNDIEHERLKRRIRVLEHQRDAYSNILNYAIARATDSSVLAEIGKRLKQMTLKPDKDGGKQ